MMSVMIGLFRETARDHDSDAPRRVEARFILADRPCTLAGWGARRAPRDQTCQHGEAAFGSASFAWVWE